METIDEHAKSEEMSISPTPALPNNLRICLVGEVMNDKETLKAAQTFGVPVITSETGMDIISDYSWTTYFILNNFDGEIFEAIPKNVHRIMGPPALQQAVEMKDGLTHHTNRPIYNYSMKGVVTCFTGIRKKDELTRLVNLIHSMGGSIRKDMNSKVTHLICNTSGGEKYQYAMTFRLAVVRSAWVYNAWENRNIPGFSANSEEFIKDHKLRAFEGLKICFFGFAQDEHQHMVEVLTNNGGAPSDLEDPECSHVIMANTGVHFPQTLPISPSSSPPNESSQESENTDSENMENDKKRLRLDEEENVKREEPQGEEDEKFQKADKIKVQNDIIIYDDVNANNSKNTEEVIRSRTDETPKSSKLFNVDNPTKVVVNLMPSDGIILKNEKEIKFNEMEIVQNVHTPTKQGPNIFSLENISPIHEEEDDFEYNYGLSNLNANTKSDKRNEKNDNFETISLMSIDSVSTLHTAETVTSARAAMDETPHSHKTGNPRSQFSSTIKDEMNSTKRPKLTRTGSFSRTLKRSMSFVAIKTPLGNVLRQRRNSVDPNASISSITSIDSIFNESIKRPVRDKIRGIRDRLTRSGKRDISGTPKGTIKHHQQILRTHKELIEQHGDNEKQSNNEEEEGYIERQQQHEQQQQQLQQIIMKNIQRSIKIPRNSESTIKQNNSDGDNEISTTTTIRKLSPSKDNDSPKRSPFIGDRKAELREDIEISVPDYAVIGGGSGSQCKSSNLNSFNDKESFQELLPPNSNKKKNMKMNSVITSSVAATTATIATSTATCCTTTIATSSTITTTFTTSTNECDISLCPTLVEKNIPVVDEHSTQAKPETKNSRTHIVKSDWFWYTIQNGYADETDYLFGDYLDSIANTPNAIDRRDSLPVNFNFNKRKRKRFSQRFQSTTEACTTPIISSGKRRSSVSDAGLLSISGSFLDCTASPDKLNHHHQLPGENGVVRLKTSSTAEDTIHHHHHEQQPPSATTKKSMRFNHFMDFYSTESNYVGILDTIVNLFKTPLEEKAETNDALLNKSEVKAIFSNFLPIHAVHRKMLERLKEILSKWHEDCLIGQIILDHRDDLMKAYPPYVNFFEQMKETLLQCDRENPRFHAFLKINQAKPECGRQTLQDLMIRPVQRLPSISLLLNDILKHTNKNNPDHKKLEDALKAIKEVMAHINEDKRKTEGQLAMFDIFNDIEGCPAHLVSSHRSFISKCEVTELSDNLSGRGDSLMLYLFSDTIEVCKKRSRSGFQSSKSPSTTKSFKHIKLMPLSTITFVIDICDSPKAFALNCRNNQDNNKEKLYSFIISDEDVDKVVYLRSLCKQMAENACRTDMEKPLVSMTSQQLDIDINDINLSTLSKAFKFATRTRLKVGRAFSFNKTPSKLKRAVSTMMTSPFGSTNSLTPASQLAQMRLASCTNISEVDRGSSIGCGGSGGSGGSINSGTTTISEDDDGSKKGSSSTQPTILIAPMSVQPTRKVTKASTLSLRRL